MRTNLLLAFLLFHSISFSQLIFEVNEPQHLVGVYPSINPSNAWNTPNLLQDGNWFSDTLVLADDGQLGFACSPILNVIENQFVLFRRQNCDIGQALLNVQNAGAAAALIIDTIDGRPLPFDDTVYPGVTIPFIIISRGTGDSLLLHLEQNADCVVSFGDKTGWTTNDLGIYMESSWWSMYGVFPFDELKFTDSTWGTWIYNHGDTDAIDAELTFYYKWKNGATQHYLDTTFTSLFVPAQDSLYFDFVFAIPDSIKYHNDIDTLFYSYALSYNDDDSLDNQVENFVIVSDNTVSLTHNFVIHDTHDYIYSPSVSPIEFQRFVFQKLPEWDQLSLNLYLFQLITLQEHQLEGYLMQLTQDFSFNQSFCNLCSPELIIDYGLNYNYVHIDPHWNFSRSVISPNGRMDIILRSIHSYYSYFGCSTDMYHDMRVKADSTFQFFIFDGDIHYLDKRITLDQFVQVEYCSTPYCTGGIDQTQLIVDLHPNPISDIVYLSSEKEIASLQLVGIEGSIFDLTWDGDGFNFQSNIAMLESGIYLLKIECSDGRRTTKRLVKN